MNYAVADCGPPPVQDFTGQVNYSNTTYGNSALYICPGDCSSNFSSCQENGEWTALMLDCFSKLATLVFSCYTRYWKTISAVL